METPKNDGVTQLSVALQQLEVLFSPFVERLKELSDAFAPHLRSLLEWNRVVDALNAVGWLPYHSAPFHYVEECGDDLALLERRCDEFYRTRWSEICDDMELRLKDYHIDDEATETYREALLAHAAGYYRCVCRVLFPEIERMIGLGRVRQEEIGKLTGTGTLADFALRERFGYVLFGRLVNHAYEQVKADRKRFERDPVPNRQAALHGLVPYSTHKHSMNMLILTDYIFQILPPMNGPET